MYSDFIVISNGKLCSRPIEEQIRRVVALSPKAVILREKDLSDQEYLELARELSAICQDKSVDLYIHSRLEISRELGIENIHLTIPQIMNSLEKPQDDILLNSSWKNISVSCHSREDIEIAESIGASQIILGTIFETQCKPGKRGAGLEFLREMTAASSVPIYAIGGIKLEHLEALKACGAQGGCMMSEFMKL